MVMFRSNIGRFLDRTKSVGKDGVRAYDEPAALPPQQPVAPPNDALLKRLEEYHNPLLREVEENIANDLKARGLTNLNDANKALIKSLAGTQLLLEFERVENTIFASQVAALTFLNPRTPTQLSDIEPFYSAAASKYPKLYENKPFHDWLSYLIAKTLVRVNEDGVEITVRGREYLKARIDQARPGPFFG